MAIAANTVCLWSLVDLDDQLEFRDVVTTEIVDTPQRITR